MEVDKNIIIKDKTCFIYPLMEITSGTLQYQSMGWKNIDQFLLVRLNIITLGQLNLTYQYITM